MTGRRLASLRRMALAAAIVPLLAVVLHLGGAEPPLVGELEAQSLKWRYQLRGTLPPSGEVALVMVDDRSLNALGRWPLSRRHLAQAVRALAADGAAVVAFDLLFPEPQAGLPDGVVDLLAAMRARLGADAGDLAGRIDRLLDDSGPDQELATAMADAGSVLVPFAFVFEPGEAGGGPMPPAVERSAFRIVMRPSETVPPAMQPAGVITPVPGLAAAAAALGHVTVRLDPDGALRHDQAAIGYGGAYFPSLPVEAVRLYAHVPKEDVSLRLGHGIAIGDRFVRTDRTMRIAVNHYGPTGTFETHSLVDVVSGALPQGTFAGRIVLVGASAPGVGDTFSTAYARTLPGAEHHATMIDNILTDRALKAGDRTVAADIGAIVLGGFAGAALGAGLPLPAAAAGVALVAGGWFMGAAHLFSTDHLMLAVAYPTIATALNFAAFAAVRLLGGRRARQLAERQRRNLMRYFSPGIVDRLMETNRPGHFDRTQHLAVLFVDLIGSTAMCERLAPAEAMALLRRFYRSVESAVRTHDGVLDKFLGDGALAVFGVSKPSPADALRALRAARRIVDGINEWRGESPDAGGPDLAVGIGLHWGPALIGDAGGEHQFNFTVIGDVVNTASRLEGLTRSLGYTIVASDTFIETARAAGGHEAVEGFVPLPVQQLRGRERPIAVWGWRP